MPSVPDITFRGSEDAIRELLRTGWVYHIDAVQEDIDETVELPDGRVNEVVGQHPDAGALSLKPLGVLLDVVAPPPTHRIDGIGPTYSGDLSKVGIDTISELSLADLGVIRTPTNVSQSRAEDWRRTARGYAKAYQLTRFDQIGSPQAEAFYEARGWGSHSDLENVDRDELIDQLDREVLDDELEEKHRGHIVEINWEALQNSINRLTEE